MLKSLYPEIDWNSVEIIGFDMDGTLYDEFDFISQVYKPIAERLSALGKDTVPAIYSRLLDRWLEKGSSYRYIFSEVLQSYDLDEPRREIIINELLDIFKNFIPQLALSSRVQYLLDFFNTNFELFLVTDGDKVLQAAKFSSLGLEKWFAPENVWISGSSEPEYQKPSKRIAEKIHILTPHSQAQQIVFFGDREIDRAFALTMGYQYVQVHRLQATG